MPDTKTVAVPVGLYEQLNEAARQSPFPHVDDLVTFILQDYLDRQQTGEQQAEDRQREQEQLNKRLRDLGYL